MKRTIELMIEIAQDKCILMSQTDIDRLNAYGKKMEERKMKDNAIKTLVEAGATRWTKKGDRLYLNKLASKAINLELDHYKTGNVSSAYLNGEKISNAKGSRIESELKRAYIDIETWTIQGCYNPDLTEQLQEYVDKVKGA